LHLAYASRRSRSSDGSWPLRGNERVVAPRGLFLLYFFFNKIGHNLVPRCSLKRTLVDRGICLSLFSQHILGRSEEKLQLGWLCYCAYSFMCRIGHPTASWLVLLLWIFLPVPYSRMHYGKPLCWNLKACLEPLLILPHLASLAQQSKDNLCSRGRANFLLRWQGNPYLGELGW
jgi:hypothetical protein